MIERIRARGLADVRAAYNALYARAEYGDKAALHHLALRCLAPPSGAPVFDVACGAGTWLRFLADRGHPTLGCELSERALEKARARVPEAALWLCDGARLPIPSGRIPFLTCLGSLEHFLDPRAGARELHRVLAPGGRAAILLPNSYYSGDIWRIIRSGYGPDHHQIIDRFASFGEWRDLLAEAGFQIQRADRYDKGKAWKRVFPFHLAYHFLFTCTRG